MSEHAPGPWHVARGRERLIALASDDGVRFGNLVPTEVVMAGTADIAFAPTHAGAANARLIAAAPDLLAALEAMTNVYCRDRYASPICDAARAALAKALRQDAPASEPGSAGEAS